MDAEESLAIWQSLFADSDSEGEFEGFTLEDLRKGEESDIDLDLIVKEGQLDSDFFENLSVSSVSTDSSEDSDANADLPQAVGPSRIKRKPRTKKKKVNANSKSWSQLDNRDNTCEPWARFQAGEGGRVAWSSTWCLPLWFFFIVSPRIIFWKNERRNKYIYAAAKQAEKGVPDKLWTM